MSRYLLKIADKITGPHSVAALQEMASVRAFDETTLITAELSEDWKSVRDIPELQALLFPARKTLTFKDKAFETLPQESSEPVSVHEILHTNLVAEAKNARPFLPGSSYRNRRRSDFLLCIVLCDLIGAAIWWYLPRNHDTTVILLSAGGIINFGLYWLFYQIMDRY
jgi:hypothetical protein